MSTAAMALSNPRIARSPRHTATIYLKEAKYEFLKNLRLRMYTASVLSFPIMFYVLFGLVLNAHEAIGGTPRAHVSDRDLRHIRRDGRIAVRHRRRPGLRPRPGMAAGKARQPHAAVRLLRRQGGHQHDFQHHHRARAVRARNHVWAVCACRSSTFATAAGDPGARFAALLCDGPGPRIFHRTELRARDHQPDLSCRCRSAADCGCRSCSCRKSCSRSRWRCRPITCRNWRWES